MVVLRKGLMAVVVIVILVIGWFSWNEIEMRVTHVVQQKVQVGLYDGLSLIVQNAPRIESSGYYIPNMDNPSQTTLIVYETVLYDMNSDLSAPMTKITTLSLVQGVRSITATAVVQFYYLPGIVRSISIRYTFPQPHFQSPIGLRLVDGQLYNVPPYHSYSTRK